MNKSELLNSMSEHARKIEDIEEAIGVSANFGTNKSTIKICTKRGEFEKLVESTISVKLSHTILNEMKKSELKYYEELKLQFEEMETNE